MALISSGRRDAYILIDATASGIIGYFRRRDGATRVFALAALISRCIAQVSPRLDDAGTHYACARIILPPQSHAIFDLRVIPSAACAT